MGTRVGSGREDEWRKPIMATQRRLMQSSVRNNLLKVNLTPKESLMCRHGGQFQHALPRNLLTFFPPSNFRILNRLVAANPQDCVSSYRSRTRVMDAPTRVLLEHKPGSPQNTAALLGNTQQ